MATDAASPVEPVMLRGSTRMRRTVELGSSKREVHSSKPASSARLGGVIFELPTSNFEP